MDATVEGSLLVGRSLAGTAGPVSAAVDRGVSFLPNRPPKTELRLLALEVVVAVAGVLEVAELGVMSAAASPATTGSDSVPVVGDVTGVVVEVVVGAAMALSVPGTVDDECSAFLPSTGSPKTRDAAQH